MGGIHDPEARRRFAAQVRAAMEQLQVSSEQLAPLLGVTPQAVRHWRSNGLSPQSGHFLPLCEELGLAPDSFGFAAPPPENEPPPSALRLGTVIRDERKKRGLTQEAVAKAVGIRRKALHRIEIGETVPKSATLLELCRLFALNEVEMLWLRTAAVKGQ